MCRSLSAQRLSERTVFVGWSEHVSTSLWDVDTVFSKLYGVTAKNIVTFTVNTFGSSNFTFWFSPVFLILRSEYLRTLRIIFEKENTITVTVVSQRKGGIYILSVPLSFFQIWAWKPLKMWDKNIINSRNMESSANFNNGPSLDFSPNDELCRTKTNTISGFVQSGEFVRYVFSVS
jgi:hypothetical protein